MATITSIFPVQSRHSRFLNRLLLSRKLQLLLGFHLTIIFPALAIWGEAIWNGADSDQLVTLFAITLAYWCSLTVLQCINQLPGTLGYFLSIPVTSVCFATLFTMLRLMSFEPSETLFLTSYFLTASFSTVGYWVAQHYRELKLAVVPYGKAPSLCHIPGVNWHSLGSPGLDNVRVDGVVADLYDDLPPEWEEFLADCTLHRIPVYHATTTYEWLTGRVQLGHLYENRYGSLQPDEGYEMIKRYLDLLTILATLPLILPIMAITAIAIRMEGPGPVLFTQQRMGFQCQPFTVYKFRSMYIDQQGMGYTENNEDPRITRVGKVIRKYRVDELPQLFNVLKGDMSLIGPRPESMDLAHWYQKDVPFFHYRHVVRPGISGWAQVEQGYAAEVDGMNQKLEYDFYYIKNISFWLDLLIVMRTIRTVLTGFGSR
ncbi:exopolysaccharide biosynthesis polyprenyl glycosylphosphotransferase [Halomonas sp. QX-2]|uniref:Exopolysaccharide biosynthesis polyprenyl glycosylphosphotransferase n=1 Tax=Vreelandella sedimenti TaxID=2729618 RepID=A0A7Z0NA17_9GAMM|nr:exopolysaccharide biosynthesis polyprenyl glycosylphosphotransferase [Halomonas sedimenti]NYT74365.1 exopolysaccharide biosynthesis polyprenyl glycosylphosphotransferase [Halomonas sedimenti]|tara:strand:+ start:17971 stop:19257 length:1287 start_codon:yes stop_codon:yes gene_type:complete